MGKKTLHEEPRSTANVSDVIASWRTKHKWRREITYLRDDAGLLSPFSSTQLNKVSCIKYFSCTVAFSSDFAVRFSLPLYATCTSNVMLYYWSMNRKIPVDIYRISHHCSSVCWILHLHFARYRTGGLQKKTVLLRSFQSYLSVCWTVCLSDIVLHHLSRSRDGDIQRKSVHPRFLSPYVAYYSHHISRSLQWLIVVSAVSFFRVFSNSYFLIKF